MVDFAESVKGALKGGLCAVLGADEAAVKLLSRLTGSPLGAYPLASGLRRQLCSDDPVNDPEYVPPFTGGQCAAPVSYSVTYQWQTISTSGAISPTPTVSTANNGGAGYPGPIAGVRSRTQPGDSAIILTYGGGLELNLRTSSANQGAFANSKIVSVARIGGQPDNCGDIGPAPVPPGPVPAPPTNITYDTGDTTNITVPLTAIFAPLFVSLDGSIKVPVTVNVGGINFDGTVKISPEFEVEISPTFNIGGPGSPDDPDVIGQPGGGPTPIPDPEDLESTIVGVLVYSDITAEAGSSGVAFTNGPDLYVPRLASVQFAVKTRNSIGWTSDLDVKNLECYIPCPAPQGAVAVRVSPMPGVQSRFTAVRGIPLTTF